MELELLLKMKKKQDLTKKIDELTKLVISQQKIIKEYDSIINEWEIELKYDLNNYLLMIN